MTDLSFLPALDQQDRHTAALRAASPRRPSSTKGSWTSPRPSCRPGGSSKRPRSDVDWVEREPTGGCKRARFAPAPQGSAGRQRRRRCSARPQAPRAALEGDSRPTVEQKDAGPRRGEVVAFCEVRGAPQERRQERRPAQHHERGGDRGGLRLSRAARGPGGIRGTEPVARPAEARQGARRRRRRLARPGSRESAADQLRTRPAHDRARARSEQRCVHLVRGRDETCPHSTGEGRDVSS
jgi:hypothetical protein